MKINPASTPTPQPLIQAINGDFSKPLKTRILSFSQFMRAKNVPLRKNIIYKGPRLQKGKVDYLEYWYRIPSGLPKEFWKKEWLSTGGELKEWARFRIKDGVNGKPVADQLYQLENLRMALEEQGYDPFAPLLELKEELILVEAPAPADPAPPPPSPLLLSDKLGLSLKGAMDLFLAQYPEKSPSVGLYHVLNNILKEYFDDRYDQALSAITSNDLSGMMDYFLNEREWKKSTFNDKAKKFKTIFGFFKGRQLLATNLADSIKLKTKVVKTKHTPFDDLLAVRVKKLLLEHKRQPEGKFVHDYFSVIYYTCARPVKEVRQFKCEDVRWSTNQIYVHPERAKGGAGGYVPMCAELKDLFIQMGVDKQPGHYYIFGSQFEPGPKPMSSSWFNQFWTLYVREPNGIHEDYTPYSWKHTRCCHLYLANANPYDIQKLCRHEDLSQTMEYLKDLGLLETHEVSKKTRKF